jgi:hypothetical protein
MELEKRAARNYLETLALECRADEDSPVIRGYAAVFNSIADFGFMREEIKPGAFARALREKQDVRALVEHDSALILGRTAAKTLTLREDETGLFAEIVPPDTQTGRDTVASLKRGDLDQMSFAFIATKVSWIEQKGMTPLRQIEDVDLFDVSVVAFPAYEATSAQVRSRIQNVCGKDVEDILKRQSFTDPAMIEVYERARRI